MIRFIAVLFGIGFIFAGVAGFLPSFNPNGMLFGMFEVNTMHNIVHLVSGVIAIMAATSHRFSRLFFQVFGVVYSIVAIVGFARGGDLMLMHVNMADNFLHLGIGVIALLIGFALSKAA